MCFGGGDDDYSGGSSGVLTPQQLQAQADTGVPLAPAQAQQQIAYGESIGASGGPHQTDFFGQDYYVPTAINPSIPAFSVGGGDSFTPEGGWSPAGGGSGPQVGGTIDSGGGGMAPGSPSIPSYGGGDSPQTGGFADLGGSGGTQFGAGASDFSTPPSVSAPPVSFGGVQSFGGGDFGSGQTSLGSASIADLAAPGSASPMMAFNSGGGAGNLTSFEPGGGISIPNDFPDPTSSAATANAGGVPTGDKPFDPFGNYDPNKNQDRVPQGGPVPGQPAPSPGVANALPPNAQPTSGPAPSGLTSGFTPGNAGNVPISALASEASSAPQPQWSADGERYLGDPSRDPSGGQPAEAFPGQNSLAKGSSASGEKADKGSFLDQLAASLGKNALGAGLAAGAGLFSMSQASKNANTPNVQGLKSTIPQIQGVINQVQQQIEKLTTEGTALRQQGSDLAAGSQPLRDKGGNIIDSAQPISEESKRLMSFVSTGTLPPEYMTQVQEGTRSAKAAAISNAAARGQNVQPGPRGDYSGNSTLQQQLQSIDRQATILSSTLAQQLYDAGVKGIAAANSTINAGTGVIGAANQTTGAGASLIQAGNSTQQNAAALTGAGLQGVNIEQDVYKKLIDLDTARSARVGQAISNFAAALGGGGGGGGTTIKVGPNGAPAST